MQVTLYQPDIAQNTGTILRLCACMGLEAGIIEPCGFPFDNRKLKRSGMDYLDQVALTRYASWDDFLSQKADNSRILLLTTKGATPYTDFTYQPDDILLLGRESAGVPEAIHSAADARLCIPMQPPARSLNVAIATAMVVGEALRQTRANAPP